MSVIADVGQFIADVPLPPLPSDMLGRMSLEQYHEMVRSGAFTENDPFELWEGVLIRKMPKSRAHCLATELAARALASCVPGGWHVESQESITLLRSELEPDVIVVRGSDRDYVAQHPGPDDLALIVEVSDSTLAYDRGFKKQLSAEAGVPVYWIVNLVDRCVEAYSDPGRQAAGWAYSQHEDHEATAEVPLAIGGKTVRVPVRDLLP